MVQQRGTVAHCAPIAQRTSPMVELSQSRAHIEAIHLEVGALAVEQYAPQLAQAIDRLGAAQSINNIRRGLAVIMLLKYQKLIQALDWRKVELTATEIFSST